MTDIKRYRLSKVFHAMNVAPDGPYVQIDDVEPLLDQLRKVRAAIIKHDCGGRDGYPSTHTTLAKIREALDL